MVGNRLVGMKVRNLNHSKQRQQEKAQHCHRRQSVCLCGVFPAELRLKSCQIAVPCFKDTQGWTHWWGRWLRIAPVIGDEPAANIDRAGSSKLCAMNQFTI